MDGGSGMIKIQIIILQKPGGYMLDPRRMDELHGGDKNMEESDE